jgi:signal transduction histidine kinase/CheY-like chemotaxis protein
MSTDSHELDERITLEALAPAFRLVRRDALWNTLIPLTVIAVMWSRIDHRVLMAWGALFVVGGVAKYALAVLYFRREVIPAEARKWAWWLTAVALYHALLWASTVFLFYVDGAPEYQIFLITLLNVIGIGSAIAALYWYPLFYVRAVPIMGALVVRLAIDGTFAYIALAALLLLGLGGTASIARAMNNSMRSEIRLRHESAALNEALHAKTLEAQQATMAKSKFLAAASHDLRQPLHALSLFIDVLKEEKSEHERQKIFPRIDLSLEALRKLFDALLDVSRLDAKVVNPEYSHFDLAEVLKSLAEEFRSAAGEKGLKLRVHADSLIVISDRLLLERILRNLVGNAIRYTESGGVLLSARNRGDTVLLQVWDTGVGIPQEYKDEIFVEFRQLHNAHRDRNQGLGLGLAIVKRLCELLHHPLELRSQPGTGSVFGLRIAKGRQSMMVVKEALSPAHSWELSGRRILVIDDEREILEAMRTLLSKWGCEVISAESLAEAVNVLNEMQITPDLIVSDLRLRDGCTGVDAIESLRAQFGASIPGILVTGETASEQLNSAKGSGYDLLQKPVRPIRLRSAIQQHLSDVKK